jgi:D-sedoheptulose 7-phosphate isomerase
MAQVALKRSTLVRAHLLDSAALKHEMAERCENQILSAADLLADCFESGSKVLLCGNGGSAAECQRMASVFVSRVTRDVDRPPLPAIALTVDTSFLTAFANGCGFDGVFERQVRALGRPGDILIGISTSGNSPNVLRAASAAREMGIKVIALTGDGGKLAGLSDIALTVPSSNTQYIQEVFLSLENVLCELVERSLFGA